MICPNCKTENKGNYCIKCGYLRNGNKDLQIIYDSVSQMSKTKEELEYYIGEDSKKILNKGCNIYALIFGPFYYLYRNCIIEGSIYLTIFTTVTVLLLRTDQRILIAFLIINALLNYMTFNSIFKKICVKEMKFTSKNQKGKSIILPFLGILVITIILCLIYRVN